MKSATVVASRVLKTFTAILPKTPRALAFYHPLRKIGAAVVMRDEDEADDEPLVVQLQRCGRIHGRLLDELGTPMDGLQVQAIGLSPVELSTEQDHYRPSFRVYTEAVKLQSLKTGLA